MEIINKTPHSVDGRPDLWWQAWCQSDHSWQVGSTSQALDASATMHSKMSLTNEFRSYCFVGDTSVGVDLRNNTLYVSTTGAYPFWWWVPVLIACKIEVVDAKGWQWSMFTLKVAVKKESIVKKWQEEEWEHTNGGVHHQQDHNHQDACSICLLIHSHAIHSHDACKCSKSMSASFLWEGLLAWWCEQCVSAGYANDHLLTHPCPQQAMALVSTGIFKADAVEARRRESWENDLEKPPKRLGEQHHLPPPLEHIGVDINVSHFKLH